MNRLLLLFMFVCLAPAAARAQCAMPSGPPVEAGVILFNDDHKVMQYCNGDKWIGLWGGRGGGGLPACANGEIAQFSGGAWQCNNGSGLTNLNASNLTSGTVPRARLGSGTANSTTFLRGDGTWAAPSGGGGTPCSPANVQTFNANGTWTKPSCGTMVKIQCWGGGGGGGRSSGSVMGFSHIGGGGGGGAMNERLMGIGELANTVSVSVGAGGAGASAVGNGQAGGNSSFGAHVIAYGGGRGSGVSGSSGASGGGGGTHGPGGNASGSAHGDGGLPNNPFYGGKGYYTEFTPFWGGGGSSTWGGAGCQGTSVYGGNGGTGNGGDGQQPGGGGCGNNGGAGGAGGDGQCVVTTY